MKKNWRKSLRESLSPRNEFSLLKKQESCLSVINRTKKEFQNPPPPIYVPDPPTGEDTTCKSEKVARSPLISFNKKKLSFKTSLKTERLSSKGNGYYISVKENQSGSIYRDPTLSI